MDAKHQKFQRFETIAGAVFEFQPAHFLRQPGSPFFRSACGSAHVLGQFHQRVAICLDLDEQFLGKLAKRLPCEVIPHGFQKLDRVQGAGQVILNLFTG